VAEQDSSQSSPFLHPAALVLHPHRLGALRCHQHCQYDSGNANASRDRYGALLRRADVAPPVPSRRVLTTVTTIILEKSAAPPADSVSEVAYRQREQSCTDTIHEFLLTFCLIGLSDWELLGELLAALEQTIEMLAHTG
jgi:hypothetical protein